MNVSDNEEYVSPRTITKKFDITTGTLRHWALQGKIKFIQPGRMRLYNLQSVRNLFNMSKEPVNERKRILYARVSSAHQKSDLDRQIEFLRSKYPTSDVMSDVGSGLNWKRKNFNALLELINKGSIFEIVIAYKDRLCRFGFELFEWICQKHNTKIVVLNSDPKIIDRSKELSDDILSIITIFVAKNNSLRACQNRKNRQETKIEKERKEKEITNSNN
jgi:predicted site-specific integrase-resolvase